MDKSKAKTSPMAEAQYDLTVSPGKGLGMFAARDIPKGTRILSEESTLAIDNSARGTDINEALQKSSQAEQVRFHRLHLPHQPEPKIPANVRRYQSNCLRMGSKAGNFWDAAHVNHSCVPNAQHLWNANLNRLTIHAIVEIDTWLFDYYGFRCGCAACRHLTTFGRKSASRRARMREIKQELDAPESHTPFNISVVQNSDAVPSAWELIDLLVEEGLVFVDLAKAFHYAAKCFADSKRPSTNVQAWQSAKMESEVYRCMVGEDSELFLEAKLFVQEMWECCEEGGGSSGG